MTVAVAGAREINGITVAVINLKLIWDVISAIHVGQSGDAFVLDRSGRLVAHPDISLVLRGDDDPAAARLKDLQKAAIDRRGETADGVNAEGRSVIAAMAPIPGPDWMAFVEQPASEAFGPIRAALWRTGLLLLAGATVRRPPRLPSCRSDDRAHSPSGAGCRAHRRRSVRSQDRYFDGRRARGARGTLQRHGRRACSFAGTIRTHFSAEAFSGTPGRRTRRGHRRSGLARQSSRGCRRDFLRPARFHRLCRQRRGGRGHGSAAGVLRGARRDHHEVRGDADLFHGGRLDAAAERAAAPARARRCSARGWCWRCRLRCRI